MKLTKVTKKEMNFLIQLSTSDFANEGWCEAEDGGVGDWVGADGKVNKPTDMYNMKVVRGLMSSLEQKKVIVISQDPEYKGYQGQPIAWVSVHEDYCDAENFKLKGLICAI